MVQNKDQALNEFIKKFNQTLSSKNLKLKNLKSLKNEYFVSELKNKAGNPTNNKICNAIIEFYIRNGLDKSRIRELINTLPIFKFISNENRTALFNKLASEDIESALTEEELELLTKTDAYKAVKKTSEGSYK